MIINADSYQYLDTLEENSIDTVITDPPYGLKFMGKKWDYDIPRKNFWEKVYRVCIPGSIMLIFGGTRTYHRLAVEIEDAGFEIRDTIMWLYGSGFPKSYDISKGIDKHLGSERTEILGYTKGRSSAIYEGGNSVGKDDPITKPESEQAQLWDGWGTALKPAFEPIIVAMKPLDGTYAENALTHGVAGLNIDGSRIGTEDNLNGGAYSGNTDKLVKEIYGEYNKLKPNQYQQPTGRFPANIILDEDSAALLDEQTKDLKGGTAVQKNRDGSVYSKVYGIKHPSANDLGYNDKGGASRFFYVAKASRSERDKGLDETTQIGHRACGDYKGTEDHGTNITNTAVKNNHPTVKPIALLEYLCKLTRSPTGGIVLDPFMGSGSMGIAALLTDREYIGIEIDQHYFEIAEKRIAAWKK